MGPCSGISADCGEGLQQVSLRSRDSDLAFAYLDPLGECAQVVAAIASTVQAHPLPGGLGEGFQHFGCDAAVGCAVEQRASAVRIGPGLIAGSLECGDSVLEVGVIQIGNAGLNGIVETFQPLVCLSGPLELSV